jgi:hypothetical protein
MTRAAVLDRRADPRLPLDAPVILMARERRVSGRSRDVSLGGLLVELSGPLSFLDHEVGVVIELPDGDSITLEADIVRRGVSETGSVLVALRFCRSSGGRALMRRVGTRPRRDYSRRVRPSRAQPRPQPDLDLVRGELRAAGSQALVLAFEDPDAEPPAGMADWVAGLAGTLGRPAPATATNRSLVRLIAELHRRLRIPDADDEEGT